MIVRARFASRLVRRRPPRRGRPWPIGRRRSLRLGLATRAQQYVAQLPHTLVLPSRPGRLRTTVRAERTVIRERIVLAHTRELLHTREAPERVPAPARAPHRAAARPAPARAHGGAPPPPRALAARTGIAQHPLRPAEPGILRLRVDRHERSERVRVAPQLRVERVTAVRASAAPVAAAPAREAAGTPAVPKRERRPAIEPVPPAPRPEGASPGIPAPAAATAGPPAVALDDIVDQVLRRIERRAIAQRERLAGV